MLNQINYRLVRLLKLFAQIISIVLILSGIIVLVGWIFDIATLKTIHPSFVSMKANTALCFVLIGTSLWLLNQNYQRRLARLCAIIVTLIGSLTLLEYLLGWSIGIDQFFFKEAIGTVGTSNPGRMAPNTALNFLLIGSGLFLLDVETKRGYRPAQLLILMEGIISLLALLGYIYGFTTFYGLPDFTKMAVHTMVLFCLIFAGVLMARPDRGWMQVITSENMGGILARRALPTFIIISLLLGWFLAWCEHRGFFAVGLKNPFFIAITIPVFSILIFTIAKSLHQMSIHHEQSESKIRQIASIVEFSNDAITSKTLDGTITSWNKSAEKIYGYTSEEIIGGSISVLLPPDYMDEMSQILERIKNDEQIDHYETKRLRKDGSEIDVSLTISPIKNNTGQIIGASTIARDITERKRSDEKIKGLNKELEAFAYSVSHDLRVPLRAIDGFSLIVSEDYGGKLDDEGKRLLKVIRDNTKKMSQLIDDLLSFSRIGRKEIVLSETDMEAMSKSVYEEIKSAVPARTIQLEIKPLPRAYVDPTMIRQVWINLLTNAIKFTGTKPNAVIEIGSKTEGDKNIYYVKENGVGFDMKYINKLFGIFQRLHSQEEFEGTGVGLALVQRIIHKHGGRVWAEGKIGEGACFYFTIPRETREDGR
jgi:PAS domain S-box-containing protein